MALVLLAAGCGASKNVTVAARSAPGAKHWSGLRFRAAVGTRPSTVDHVLVVGKSFDVRLKPDSYLLTVASCAARCRPVCARRVRLPSGHKIAATVTFFGQRCAVNLRLAD